MSAAVHELVDALVEVVIVEGRPLPIRWFRFTSVVARATAASTAFLAAVEEKDRDFALWVVLQSQTLIGDRGERVVWSSKLLASVRLWQIRPAQMRAQATAELPALRALTAE
ncbi:hypothetical protein DEU34_3072 [Microbacterium sp. AG1240]|nr:hypothetical protein DEU34_3072 [Microbacterium sp. AG1240]